MAEIRSFPNNQSTYVGAEWVMRWLHGRTSGVFGAAGNAAVAVVPSSMSVTVSDGIGWITDARGNGIVWWVDDEATSGTKHTLSVSTANSTYDRIDRVIVEWETTNYVALPQLKILAGTPAATPAAPALTNNNQKRQISLAQILVPAGASVLSASSITDERLNGAVCGIVTESISVDTSVMQAQMEALLEAIQQELANITGGSEYDLKPIRQANVTVSGSSFEEFESDSAEETALIDMGYTYRAAVPVSGVLATMTPYLTFSLPSVDACGASIANQFACYAGGVYLYADAEPSESVTILTAEFRKAVT